MSNCTINYCLLYKQLFLSLGETATLENESQSLVGMTTPNKKKCFSFRVLSRISKLCSGGSTTPVSSNRQAKKRKLFETGKEYDLFLTIISTLN